VQVADINKGMFTHKYQSAMALIVIDFTYLEGRGGGLVVKELAAADSQSNRVSSYVFRRPYAWEEVPVFTGRINQVIDHGCNWNYGDMLYSELETVLHRETSSAVAIYCFGPQKSEFISNLIDRTVIDITQLGCPQLADIVFTTISCTFPCHKNLNIFVLCDRLLLWHNGCTFTFLVFSMQDVRFNLAVINVFQLWTLLERVFPKQVEDAHSSSPSFWMRT
jgi:hypothetical protein